MESEYNNRVKTTRAQYDLAQNQFNTLKNTCDQTNQKLLAIQTKETNVILFH